MKNNLVTITLGRYKTSPSLYNTEDFTAVYQFSVLQPIKRHLPEDRYKLARGNERVRGRGREMQRKIHSRGYSQGFLGFHLGTVPKPKL